MLCRAPASAEGCALVAAVAEQIALEAERGPSAAAAAATPARSSVLAGCSLRSSSEPVLVAHDAELDASPRGSTAMPPPRRSEPSGASGCRPLPPRAAPRRRRPAPKSEALAQPAPQPSARPQRAKLVCSVVKGIPEKSLPSHCIPPKVSIQISPMTRLRKLRSGFCRGDARRPARGPWPPARPRRRR